MVQKLDLVKVLESLVERLPLDFGVCQQLRSYFLQQVLLRHLIIRPIFLRVKEVLSCHCLLLPRHFGLLTDQRAHISVARHILSGEFCSLGTEYVRLRLLGFGRLLRI